MAEPPYRVIWNRIKSGKVISFLGAGASLVGRRSDVPWDAQQPQFLPSRRELSHFLAHESKFPSQDPYDLDDLAKVAVAPGLYTLYYWFKGKDDNGEDLFYAATISGFRLDEQGNEIGEVISQAVPAVPSPSTFVDDPDIVVVEEEADAQISDCRILRRGTFFQKICT
jgi:hypothetical protein